MKILYAGSLDPYGTCFSRLVALRQIHHDIVTFDADPHYSRVLAISRWKRDLVIPSLVNATSHKLLELCESVRPDILWLDTGEWLTRQTLLHLKSIGIFTVRHTTDALFPKRPLLLRFRRYRLRHTIPDFNLVFTSNERDVEVLQRKLGAKIQLTDLGYDHRRFTSEPLNHDVAKKWKNDIVFVGHYEARTENAVIALLDAGFNISVYGHPPWFRSKHRDRLGGHLHSQLSNADYEAAIKAAKIGFCCISEWNYNQTAGRSFEIPGSGTFLLAMRTPRHTAFYKEGVEAEFFGDHEELIRKAKFYLSNDEERKAIGAAGHRRCIESGYSWDAIMQRDWKTLMNAFENWKANK